MGRFHSLEDHFGVMLTEVIRPAYTLPNPPGCSERPYISKPPPWGSHDVTSWEDVRNILHHVRILVSVYDAARIMAASREGWAEVEFTQYFIFFGFHAARCRVVFGPDTFVQEYPGLRERGHAWHGPFPPPLEGEKFRICEDLLGLRTHETQIREFVAARVELDARRALLA